MVLTPRTEHLQNPHQKLNQEQKGQTKSIPPAPPEDRIFISQSIGVQRPLSCARIPPSLGVFFSFPFPPEKKKKEISPSPFTLKHF